MIASVQRFLPPLLLLAASCGGGDSPGNNSSGDCVLTGTQGPAGATCCNGMTVTGKTGDFYSCSQPVGGPCYADNRPNVILNGKSCCNTHGGSTYLGTVGTCEGGGSVNCAGDATCRLGTVCFSSGFCGGGCLTTGEGTATAQRPCCAGLTTSSGGVCYLPAGQLCNEDGECLSRVCKPSGTVARCQ